MRKLFVIAAFACCAGPCVSQDVSRHEVAAGVAFSTDIPNGGIPELSPYYTRGVFLSPDIRYTFNLNRNIAIETEASDSVDIEQVNVREGGHQLLALAGVKAGIRHGRFGFFGTSSAGAVSFTRGQGMFTPTGAIQYQRVTHFALKQGVAIEYAASPRTFVRFDAAELLDAQFQREYLRTPTVAIESWSTVPYHLMTSLTVGRRFGGLHTMNALPDDRKTRGYSLGGFFGVGLQEHLLQNSVRADGGGGAWAGFPVWKFISGDIIAFDQPHDDHAANYQDGGTTFQAYAGPKIGFRKGPLGLYAKARPGIMRFSRTDVSDTLTPNSIDGVFHPKIDFALDTGLVMEYTPMRHAVMRFEGGSTYDHYKAATNTFTIIQPGAPTQVLKTYAPPQRHGTMLFLIGIGYSF